ncbi:cyanate permease [Streptococcus pneumoniae]|nr:cyanate permease [Streptococcus pneumoniae]
MKKQSLFFVPGIILIGVSLRTPFTVLPIILGNISQGLEVEVSSLGVLTSLPLLMFTLFSPFSTQLVFTIFYPTGSENRLGASLHLQPLLLDHRLTYSTNQSAPTLSRNLDGWGKCRSHQCPAS